jgi:hypothetical protein
VPAEQFLLRHVGRPMHFQTLPHTAVMVLVLPSTVLKPLLGNRVATGPANSAEVRLLTAHAGTVELTASAHRDHAGHRESTPRAAHEHSHQILGTGELSFSGLVRHLKRGPSSP